jgi:phospholipid-transporting ATPase
VHSLSLTVLCEHPNSSIHSFNGTLVYDDREVAVDASNFLLRGSAVRNTTWCIGVVVYTGSQSKIVLNSRGAPSKMSTIEKTMNNLIYVIFSAQVLLSTISLVCYIVWNTYHFNELTYLCYNYEYSSNPIYRNSCSSDFVEYSFAGYFFTFFILYNNFLPISLYMTVEFCNYVQAFYIDSDLEMYDGESDTPALARTSNMNGDLGMIDYVFSDKTGTLTQNEMRFRRCSVDGKLFGMSIGALELQTDPLHGDSIASLRKLSGDLSSVFADFALTLAVAHTVIIDGESGSLQSESPDEEALVSAGTELGWQFVGRRSDKVTVRRICHDGERGEGPEEIADGMELTFHIVAVIPFDSTRKRMSVIALHPLSGQTVVFCKGADNVIFDRATNYAENSSRSQLEEHLKVFATDGLRTLVLATRIMDPIEVQQFMTIWTESQGVVVGRKELMHKAAAIVERNMTVLGATAIEDRLQDGVPETIADLRTAGVKLWVLTGDKVETAVNIAYSCKLIDDEMILIRLHESGDDVASVIHHLEYLLQKLKRIAFNDKSLKKMWHEANASSITRSNAQENERFMEFKRSMDSINGAYILNMQCWKL